MLQCVDKACIYGVTCFNNRSYEFSRYLFLVMQFHQRGKKEVALVSKDFPLAFPHKLSLRFLEHRQSVCGSEASRSLPSSLEAQGIEPATVDELTTVVEVGVPHHTMTREIGQSVQDSVSSRAVEAPS